MPACRRLLTVLCAVMALVVAPAGFARAGTAVMTAAAGIRHVFVIVLENKNYDDTFVSSTQDPYLQKTLVPMGALLHRYYGTGHVSLDNYIAMISGQAATADTANDCVPDYVGSVTNFDDVRQTGTTSDGQVIATGGCVYPPGVKTLADQLVAAGLTWKGYMEDMGNDPARESATCGHPAIGAGTDHTGTAEAPSAAVPQGDAYATRHNPFAYFHSIIDSPSCAKRIVNLGQLSTDLAHASSTPNFVFITPNLCHDGHDGNGTGAVGTTCANGEPGGLTSADAFLRTWVPRILAAPAYQADGLLVITFDESNYTVSRSADAATGHTRIDVTFPGETCCHQQPGPNLKSARPTIFTITDTPRLTERVVFAGFGGDRIGAVLLSPFIKPGSTSDTPYNHYSLLRSLEDIFGIRRHLGYAADNPATGYRLDTLGNDRSIFLPPRLSPIAALGRRLFFDPALSRSGRLSCASCHSPEHAYGPPNALAAQPGGAALEARGARAVPSLRYVLDRTPIWSKAYVGNLAERLLEGDEPPAGGFGWDGRFGALREQADFALLAPSEMANLGAHEVAAALARAAYAGDFRRLFGANVFDDPARAYRKGLLAIERFELEDPSFHPYDSKYDEYLDGRVALSERELRGLALFEDPTRGNCAACHPDRRGADGSHPLFTDFQFAALGVPRNPELAANAAPGYFDEGLCGPLRTDQAGESRYCGMFKTPTLRNIATRGVFFHNGRFHSLRDALRFYVRRDTDPQLWYPRSGASAVDKFDDLPVPLRANVDVKDAPLTRGLGAAPAWSDADIEDVIAFLQTLTDRDAQPALPLQASSSADPR